MKPGKKCLLILAALVLALPAAAQTGDAKGCKDDALFPTRMPNYRIEKCEKKAFDSYDFFTVKPPKRRVEGELTFITYTVDRREDERTALEVVRNYENALRKIGAKIQGVNPTWWVNGTITADGREIWAQAEKGNGKIWIRIVRPKAMEQVIVADAAALANDLKTTGHTAVNGIYFDTGKAELKPESANAVGEIAKLLKGDPGLKVFVVGHTDTVGSVDSNLKLSQDRADSVIRALVTAGVAPARLRGFGNGPFAPVGSNGTDEGRAMNRRVELVKQ
ncbi:MAG: OmpA family protein [Thermoanaerobaculia bacterium]